MNLYLIRREVNCDGDRESVAVVCAESGIDAIDFAIVAVGAHSFLSEPSFMRIGIADESMEEGVVLLN